METFPTQGASVSFMGREVQAERRFLRLLAKTRWRVIAFLP